MMYENLKPLFFKKIYKLVKHLIRYPNYLGRNLFMSKYDYFERLTDG